MENPNCDGGKCRSRTGETRRLPIGGGGNLLLCRACYVHEMNYRHDLIRDGSGEITPSWRSLGVVSKGGAR